MQTIDHEAKIQISNTIKFLITHSVHMHSISAIGYTAVHLAGRQQDEGLARRLLEAGASANTRRGVDAPLHVAVHIVGHALVRPLLSHGADPNKRNEHGDAPLHTALRATNLTYVAKTVSALVTAGASTTMRTHHGLTAWELARVKGIDEVHAWFLNGYTS